MSLWTEFFAPGEQERGAELDKRIAEQQANLRERGIWNDAQYAAAVENTQGNQSSGYDTQIRTAFGEGVSEGADNIRGAVGDTINGVTGTVASLIPWQVWLAVAGWLVWKFKLIKL